MSNTLTRKPVHMIAANDELLSKADAGQLRGGTDYEHNVDTVSLRAIPQTYRAPVDRVNGNEMFRRFLSGMLDLKYSARKVVDAIHHVKLGFALSPEDRAVLVAMFPGVPAFGGADAGLAEAVSRVNIRISGPERDAIRQIVSMHFAEEMNWNAGLGGGSVPGRSSTYTP